MAGFTVDPSSLQGLSGTLADVYGLMATIEKYSPDFSASLGGPALSSALTSFSQSWQYGLEQVGANVQGAVDNLQQAAERYAETEDNVCIAAAPVSGQG
jgi:hypothetical protein